MTDKYSGSQVSAAGYQVRVFWFGYGCRSRTCTWCWTP